MSDPNEEKIKYLLQAHNEVRDEIKRRITQRDNFSIQFIVAVGAALTLGFLDFKGAPFLFFLLPLISLFYSVQILYSYSIHDRCHKFLTEKIEPELAALLEYGKRRNDLMWESYCKVDAKKKSIKTPGIRKRFFEVIIFIMPVVSSALFMLVTCMKYRFVYRWWVNLIIAVGVLIFFLLYDWYLICRFKRADSMRDSTKVDYTINESSPEKGQKAIFLDRDGTIHVDKVNTHKIEDLEYFPDTFSALKELYDLGYCFIIISNQDGIKRGLYGVKEMHAFNEKIVNDFKEQGMKISAIYYSPCEKKDNDYSFKPNPGMIERACNDFDIIPQKSYFIGDQVSDMVAAYRAQVNPVMVKTGIYNPKQKQKGLKEVNPPVFDSLTECCNHIKENS